MREPGLCVLHVAQTGHRAVLEGLVYTTRVIAAQGLRQVVLAMGDGPRDTDREVPHAEVRPLRVASGTVFGGLGARLDVLRGEVVAMRNEATLYAVHFHGLAACLLGTRAMREGAAHIRVLYSPHGRSEASRWAAACLVRLLWRRRAGLHQSSLASSLAEAQALSRLLSRSAELLPQAVADCYFAARREPEAQPFIVAEGENVEAVNKVARLCVLLNGRAPRVRFAWLGAAEGDAAAKLEAASVRVLGPADETARAQCLSRAWAYLQFSAGDRPPVAMAQAMAAGVPCLVPDVPAHRAVIQQGETGFVCASEPDFLERLVFLLRHGEERERLGEAARAEAARRFTWRHFERAVLRAYGFST